MRSLLAAGLGELRYEPIDKRIRAVLDGGTVVDTTRAVLVWEPRRIVPSYAVPADDIAAELTPVGLVATDTADSTGARMPELSARPVLDPSVPFTVHSAEGRAADLRAGRRQLAGAAFRPADPALDGYVVLDFRAFDTWYEEDELNVAHPRDPFHRIEVIPSSRHVRVELDGHVLAESSRPTLLFETMLPTRYYLPADDIRAELTPSSTRTWCAYKGEASYWSAAAGDRVVADIGWTYQEPRHDAAHVQGLVAFFNERLDFIVDGERAERPITPWSPRPKA
ncbi:DUF427 domain-containing protein [Streptacidiphilus rugosus]|uniref:DUF427 domain-containing protein n=1 Tax=Streptacidiphilus rugosus TaxID=405783 RepID=UPI000AEE3665|nr:DUF427 domain-containing protein [Streptacidiphilus rugosus]